MGSGENIPKIDAQALHADLKFIMEKHGFKLRKINQAQGKRGQEDEYCFIFRIRDDQGALITEMCTETRIGAVLQMLKITPEAIPMVMMRAMSGAFKQDKEGE